MSTEGDEVELWKQAEEWPRMVCACVGVHACAKIQGENSREGAVDRQMLPRFKMKSGR